MTTTDTTTTTTYEPGTYAAGARPLADLSGALLDVLDSLLTAARDAGIDETVIDAVESAAIALDDAVAGTRDLVLEERPVRRSHVTTESIRAAYGIVLPRSVPRSEWLPAVVADGEAGTILRSDAYDRLVAIGERAQNYRVPAKWTKRDFLAAIDSDDIRKVVCVWIRSHEQTDTAYGRALYKKYIKDGKNPLQKASIGVLRDIKNGILVGDDKKDGRYTIDVEALKRHLTSLLDLWYSEALSKPANHTPNAPKAKKTPTERASAILSKMSKSELDALVASLAQ